MKRITRNQHPIDRLADIRQEVSRLQAEADSIRDQILNGEIASAGDFYGVEVVKRTYRSVPISVAERTLPIELLNAIVSVKCTSIVRLHKVSHLS